MRKKYDQPALLTMNYTFDPKLLELVANTYELRPNNEDKLIQKRSLSERRLIATSGSSSFGKNRIERNKSHSRFFSANKN